MTIVLACQNGKGERSIQKKSSTPRSSFRLGAEDDFRNTTTNTQK